MSKRKKLQMNIVTLLLLCLGLCITSIAVSYTIIKVENNYFKTGGIDIDLKGAYNGGKTIISTDKLLEPGMTIEEEFTITNKGNWDIFYKLYFERVEGKLGDALEIKIYKKGSPEIVLLSGKMSSLVDADNLNIADKLAAGATQTLIASLHFPEEEGNEYQGETLEFDIAAIAVQTQNNNPENPSFK